MNFIKGFDLGKLEGELRHMYRHTKLFQRYIAVNFIKSLCLRKLDSEIWCISTTHSLNDLCSKTICYHAQFFTILYGSVQHLINFLKIKVLNIMLNSCNSHTAFYFNFNHCS